MNTDDARRLFEGLLHRVAPEVDLGEVDASAPMQEAMDLDSMDFLNLVAGLYEATGIDVPERDYPRVSSVDGFVDYIVEASRA